MSTQAEIEAYNYAEFVGTDDFLSFRTVLPVGSQAPDFPAVLAATGQEVRTSDYWQDRDLQEIWPDWPNGWR